MSGLGLTYGEVMALPVSRKYALITVLKKIRDKEAAALRRMARTH